MSRDYRVYLEDILEAIGRIQSYMAGFSYDSFRVDPKTVDAVVRNLEIIGEAVKHVPEGIRIKHLDVDWKKIAGLRDILIHDYFGIDLELIWDVLQNKLTPLATAVSRILGESP
jgi:uncharacterized protein with HEPN domain